VQAARYRDDGIGIDAIDPGPLRAGWVRVRVQACGICGTDLHAWADPKRAPRCIPGHEIVGIPADGPAGTPDRLCAIHPRVACGACAFCKSGARHLCSRGELIGITRHGGWAEQVDCPRENLVAVPATLEPVEAALTEPFAVALRGLARARIAASSRVLVVGAGSVGLITALLARDRVARVAVSARYPAQHAAAERLGVVALSSEIFESAVAELQPDVVIETVGGNADTLTTAIRACRPGGRVVVLGVFDGQAMIDARTLVLHELELIASNTYASDARGCEFESAVEWLVRHRSELATLCTHQFPLAAVADALRCAADKTAGSIKVSLIVG